MDLESPMMRLYRFLSLEETELIRSQGLDFDLSYLDMVYLDLILLEDRCTPSLIAERLGIARSAVTVRLNKLEKNGFIERTRNDEDKRSSVLGLTEKGMEWFRPMFDEFESFEAMIRSRFTDEEIGIVRRMIDCISEQSGRSIRRRLPLNL